MLHQKGQPLLNAYLGHKLQNGVPSFGPLSSAMQPVAVFCGLNGVVVVVSGRADTPLLRVLGDDDGGNTDVCMCSLFTSNI